MSKMKIKSTTDTSWEQLVAICESELEDCRLSQIVRHTALVAQVSSTPEMKLLNKLCFSPGECKDFFLPTMPNPVNEIKKWKKILVEDEKVSGVSVSNLKIWVCRCGEPVLIGECGMPWVKSKCSHCGTEVGGERHKAVEGFTDNVEGCGRGHNLGDPNSRREQDGERSLYGANLHIVRALIHSSMIWGTTKHNEEVQNLTDMPQGAEHVRTHLFGHLQKDIELLAKVLGKSEEDAEMIVHLFLKFILESSREPNIQIHITDSEKTREEWEKVIHQRLQVFFQNFEAELLDVQSKILRSGGMGTLAKLIYSKEPALKDLPTSGIYDLPLMWSFEQRMTIQRFSHLIEQNNERENVSVLSELLKSHAHIQYIRYLPQVLSLQRKLMCYFENLDLQCYSDVPINTFKKENVAEHEQQAFSESAEIVKLLWKHLRSINYLQITAELKEKHENELMILDLLPTESSAIWIIAKYLVQMQNNFIQMTNPTADRVITANELKPSHVITCDPDQDFLTIAISNIDHVVYEDGKQSTNYNFKTVERQIIDRFFTEKPAIKITTLPLFEYDTGTTLRAFFSKVKDKLEPLNTNDRNCIMNDFRFLNEIAAALSTLRIVIGFLKLSFRHPEQKLMTYVKKDLKLDDRVQTLNLQVLRSSHLKHIQSLWEALSLRQSSLLIEMNQNPFIMIEDCFHEKFTKDQNNENKAILANIPNLDVLITELHYVILNIKLKDVRSNWTIVETFEAFLDCDEINEKAMECVRDLHQMEMKYGIALWKLAVQIKKGIKSTESV